MKKKNKGTWGLWLLSLFILILVIASVGQAAILAGTAFLLVAIGCNPLFLNYLEKKKKKPPKGVLVLALASLFATAAFALPEQEQSEEAVKAKDTGMLQVHFIDVGQADCILLKSEDSFLLVDAGNNDDGELVVSYLKEQGVERLEYVIGTHPHEDHIGGLDDVIHAFDIGTVIMPPKAHTTRTFEAVLEALEEKDLEITEPVTGESRQLGSTAFTILGPNDDYGDELNNWSVGIRVVCGSNSFVMCGDAENEAEIDMIASGAELSADVLKVSHHGSDTSTSLPFLEKVSPSYAVISVGKGNDYGHPTEQTLKRLQDAGAVCLRTDEMGTLIAESDGTNIVWNVDIGLNGISAGDLSGGSEAEKKGEEQTAAGESATEDRLPETILTESISSESSTTIETTLSKTAQEEALPIETTLSETSSEEIRSIENVSIETAPIETTQITTERTYILNTNTKKFHYSSCSHADRISEKNRQEYTGTREAAIGMGYEPCKVCNP